MSVHKALAEWKNVKYLKIHSLGPPEIHPYKFNLMLPEPLASWDVYDYWERARTLSIQENLKRGDVLFDIGAEYGWQSVIYSMFVGPNNMVLMEPTAEYWPNIKEIWDRNGLEKPRGFWAGLVGSENKNLPAMAKLTDWPEIANGDQLADHMGYTYIHEHGHVLPQITIDKYVEITSIIPDALTMDTEGAEILVLLGARKTLEKYKPIVWASLHPDLAIKNYGSAVQRIHILMEDLGYKSKFLDEDHEEHWVFWHPDRGELRE